MTTDVEDRLVVNISYNTEEWIIPVDYIKWLAATKIMKSRRKKEKKVDSWLHLYNKLFQHNYQISKFIRNRKECTWDDLVGVAEKIRSDCEVPSLYHAGIRVQMASRCGR